MAKFATPEMEVVMFGHCYEEGSRGMSGGAAKHDKVWGVAKIGDKLVRFWGRRGGKLRVIKQSMRDLQDLREQFEGQVQKGYTAIQNAEMRERLVPGLMNYIVTAAL